MLCLCASSELNVLDRNIMQSLGSGVLNSSIVALWRHFSCLGGVQTENESLPLTLISNLEPDLITQ